LAKTVQTIHDSLQFPPEFSGILGQISVVLGKIDFPEIKGFYGTVLHVPFEKGRG
jgi:hypothetical protein